MNKVSEEVRIGQEVSVRVLSAEGKLSLSMKPMSFLEKKTHEKSVSHMSSVQGAPGWLCVFWGMKNYPVMWGIIIGQYKHPF